MTIYLVDTFSPFIQFAVLLFSFDYGTVIPERTQQMKLFDTYRFRRKNPSDIFLHKKRERKNAICIFIATTICLPHIVKLSVDSNREQVSQSGGKENETSPKAINSFVIELYACVVFCCCCCCHVVASFSFYSTVLAFIAFCLYTFFCVCTYFMPNRIM